MGSGPKADAGADCAATEDVCAALDTVAGADATDCGAHMGPTRRLQPVDRSRSPVRSRGAWAATPSGSCTHGE